MAPNLFAPCRLGISYRILSRIKVASMKINHTRKSITLMDAHERETPLMILGCHVFLTQLFAVGGPLW
jgi:hypothetical protein